MAPSITLNVVMGACLMNYFLASAMNTMPPPEAKLYSGFSRQCPQGNEDCKFVSKESADDALYFKCRENKICFCARGVAPSDVLVWPVQWDKEHEKCEVARGGPCGAENNGLDVSCMPGLNCIEGRCRNSTELNNGQPNQFCNDDFDCQVGLSCQPPPQKMEIRIKRCLSF